MNVCFRPTGIIHQAVPDYSGLAFVQGKTYCGKRFEGIKGRTFSDWSKWVKEDVTCKACLKVRRGPNG